jgi:hypothetical protein
MSGDLRFYRLEINHGELWVSTRPMGSVANASNRSTRSNFPKSLGNCPNSVRQSAFSTPWLLDREFD